MKRLYGLVLLLSFLIIACDQEPLFWDIAHEYPPIEALIKGSPSRIAAVEYSNPDPDLKRTVLYVSNGDIWEWDISASPDHPAWAKMAIQPDGKIKTLAAIGEVLFSLDWNGNIKKWGGQAWSSVDGISGRPEQIFGAGDCLFAGSLAGTPGTKTGYCILAMGVNDNTMIQIKSDTGLLMGAAENGGVFFLGTRGDGILLTSSPTVPSPAYVYGEGDSSIIGLIEHSGIIVAITTGRQIVYGGAGGFAEFVPSNSADLSGAMASWENSNGDQLLLLGLQRSSGSFGYGYRELIWDNRSLYAPGGEGAFSSVEKNLQYISAIGNHAVHALYAIPASVTAAGKADDMGRPIVFASTQKSGLWSYRTRGGQAQWNGEDNSN